MKARGVASEETRHHLQDAHRRVMSVAAVQSHLHASAGVEKIEVGPYLTQLCLSLAASMIGEHQPISLTVIADAGVSAFAQAVSLGLIVTELVINAFKYAFPSGQPDAMVLVTYESVDADWKLVVSDNSVGLIGTAAPVIPGAAQSGGLGTLTVRSLVQQLGARLDVVPVSLGYCLAITRSLASSRPQAA